MKIEINLDVENLKKGFTIECEGVIKEKPKNIIEIVIFEKIIRRKLHEIKEEIEKDKDFISAVATIDNISGKNKRGRNEKKDLDKIISKLENLLREL